MEKSRRLTCTALAGVAFISGCGGSQPAHGADLTTAALTTKCAALSGQTVAGVSVTSAVMVAPVANTTDFSICKVQGTRAPFLDIEVDLPASWSGRYWQNGGGGFNGTIPSAFTTATDGRVTAIHPMLASRKSVYAASNGGNRASVAAQAAPAIWATGTADGNASAIDYNYRSLETTLGFAKALTTQFYGKAARYRYFNGCSNGGREAYIAAERWPDDFDGVVSGCETSDMASQTAAWLSLSKIAGTAEAPTTSQYQYAYAQALNACDANDGVKDGYMTNPASCTFDPSALLCGSGSATASSDTTKCMSAPQVQTLKNLLGPLSTDDGTLVYSGYNWTDFSARAAQFGVLGSGFAMLATGDASWLTASKQASFDLKTDYPRIRTGLLAAGADHQLSALAKFIASGKKLLAWHDTGDNLLSGKDHLRRHAALLSAANQLNAQASSNTRFMLVPSANHSVGKAYDEVNWHGTISDWVENGSVPEQLTLNIKATSTASARTLPVCQSPKAAYYNGSGDMNSAASFTCR